MAVQHCLRCNRWQAGVFPNGLPRAHLACGGAALQHNICHNVLLLPNYDVLHPRALQTGVAVEQQLSVVGGLCGCLATELCSSQVKELWSFNMSLNQNFMFLGSDFSSSGRVYLGTGHLHGLHVQLHCPLHHVPDHPHCPLVQGTSHVLVHDGAGVKDQVLPHLGRGWEGVGSGAGGGVNHGGLLLLHHNVAGSVVLGLQGTGGAHSQGLNQHV